MFFFFFYKFFNVFIHCNPICNVGHMNEFMCILSSHWWWAVFVQVNGFQTVSLDQLNERPLSSLSDHGQKGVSLGWAANTLCFYIQWIVSLGKQLLPGDGPKGGQVSEFNIGIFRCRAATAAIRGQLSYIPEKLETDKLKVCAWYLKWTNSVVHYMCLSEYNSWLKCNECLLNSLRTFVVYVHAVCRVGFHSIMS